MAFLTCDLLSWSYRCRDNIQLREKLNLKNVVVIVFSKTTDLYRACLIEDVRMFTNGITLRQGREPLCPSHPAVRRADAETLRVEWAERRFVDKHNMCSHWQQRGLVMASCENPFSYTLCYSVFLRHSLRDYPDCLCVYNNSKLVLGL